MSGNVIVRKIVVLKDLSLHRIDSDEELNNIDPKLVLFTLEITLRDSKVSKITVISDTGRRTLCSEEESSNSEKERQPCDMVLHRYIQRYCLKCKDEQSTQ